MDKNTLNYLGEIVASFSAWYAYESARLGEPVQAIDGARREQIDREIERESNEKEVGISPTSPLFFIIVKPLLRGFALSGNCAKICDCGCCREPVPLNAPIHHTDENGNERHEHIHHR